MLYLARLRMVLRRKVVKSSLKFAQNRRLFSYMTRVYAMEPKRVLVFYEEGSESVDISFRYMNEARQIDRIFNLKRKKEEEIAAVLNRMSANISNVGNKKKKKKEVPSELVPVGMVATSPPNSSHSLPGETSCFDAFVQYAMNHNLVIGGENYFLDVNPPVVQRAELPKCIMAGFSLSVSRLKTLYCDKDLCTFQWFKSDLKFDSVKDAQGRLNSIKWLEKGKGYIMEITNEDIGSLIKVAITPCLNERSGEPVEILSPALVSAGPGECPFDRRHQYTKEYAGEKCLRVISYNILADLYASTEKARTYLFATCPPYAMDIDYRKQLLLKEILGYNGDIICLQEVDEKVFEYDLEPVLKSRGYESCYDAKGGQVSEGIAMIFQKSKLRLLERNRFVLSEELQTNVLFKEIWEKLQCNKTLKERIEQRSTTFQVSIMESVEDPNKLLVIGNTHLYFHPNADHIRMLQGGICMQILKQVICLYQAKHPEKDIGLLFCGDFNSTPEFGIFRFLTTQFVSTDDVDWNSCPEELIKGIELHHDFEMDSACGCPPYTNYTVGFNGCLDYIFYQTDKFTVKQVIPMPSHEEVIENIALPSIVFPSDHIPLIADLEFRSS
ncbi:Endonuclease/Exonuclease/phosphatase [Halocaridina rubra]|uniref:2',5'-phosphodiesterase 12 n=1 Tax=Halocaridina rubra TaxID=373956 RepID=A0AAN8WGV9_HALRR